MIETLLVVLTLLFTFLKISGVITWSWLLVFTPLIIGLILFFLILLFILLMSYIEMRREEKEREIFWRKYGQRR